MFDKFDFDLDSERLKEFIKDHILKFIVGFVVVMFCLIGFMVFNILKPKEQINQNYISKSELKSSHKDLLKSDDYKKTIGLDFIQMLFSFDQKNVNKLQNLVSDSQLKDSLSKDFKGHDKQAIESIKLISSTKKVPEVFSDTSDEEEMSDVSSTIEMQQEVYEIKTSHAKYMAILLLEENKIKRYDYVEMVR